MALTTLKYLLYKVTNAASIFFFTRRNCPLIRTFNGSTKQPNFFYFDLNHSTTHLGDRLFFFPLLYVLINNGYSVCVSSSDVTTRDMFKKIYGIPISFIPEGITTDSIFLPQPSFLSSFNKIEMGYVIDFGDCTTSSKITEQLIYSFNTQFLLEIRNPRIDLPPNPTISRFLNANETYYIFSNYINSGSFRRHFVNQDVLISKALEMKRLGYKIIHVGSSADATNDCVTYQFVDIDLRGKTSIIDSIELINSPNVHGSITYDNFFMHLTGLYGKIAYVLFRGRFTRKNREHHMLYVNNTFFDQKDKLIYL